MKPVLILQHLTPEYPAYLATWLKKHNVPYVTFNAEIDGKFPDSIEPYSALAVMGGPMSANEPRLSNRQAEILILQAMHYDIPVIGHCLGGQLMAKALGAKVVASPKPEIGWQNISWIDDESTFEWFGDNPSTQIIHWHYESFNLPTGAKLLATTEACPNQAFSIGKHLAMQFHIEMDNDKVFVWVNDDSDEKWHNAKKTYNTVQDKDEMIEGLKYLKDHQLVADRVYTKWLETTIWSANTKNN